MLGESNAIWVPHGVVVRLAEPSDDSCDRLISVKGDQEALREDASSESALGWVPLPHAVWINPPATTTAQDAPGPTIITPDDPQHGDIRGPQRLIGAPAARRSHRWSCYSKF